FPALAPGAFSPWTVRYSPCAVRVVRAELQATASEAGKVSRRPSSRAFSRRSRSTSVLERLSAPSSSRAGLRSPRKPYHSPALTYLTICIHIEARESVRPAVWRLLSARRSRRRSFDRAPCEYAAEFVTNWQRRAAVVSVTAYHSFAGEVEALNTPTIRRLTPSCRHQLPPIAQGERARGTNALCR